MAVRGKRPGSCSRACCWAARATRGHVVSCQPLVEHIEHRLMAPLVRVKDVVQPVHRVETLVRQPVDRFRADEVDAIAALVLRVAQLQVIPGQGVFHLPEVVEPQLPCFHPHGIGYLRTVRRTGLAPVSPLQVPEWGVHDGAGEPGNREGSAQPYVGGARAQAADVGAAQVAVGRKRSADQVSSMETCRTGWMPWEARAWASRSRLRSVPSFPPLG